MDADDFPNLDYPVRLAGANTSPRPYCDASDFEQMKEILIAGRQADNGSYYVHVGDLCWWLYYPSFQENPREYIYLWDDPESKDKLAGWALLSPGWRTLDVFVSPGYHRSERAVAMFAWSVERITQIVGAGTGASVRTMWVKEDDHWTVSLLQGFGFERQTSYMLYMERFLDEPMPAVALPRKFQARHVAGEPEAQLRAASSYAAFNSDLPFEQYLQRYLKFMHSPAYTPEQDLVVQAPDGRFAAFCYCWLDTDNRVGLFEPVGAYPDFQNRGLGKAVLAEGIRRMQVSGMRIASVCVDCKNLPAQRLYQSLGFRVIYRLETYQKSIASQSRTDDA